MAIEPEELKKSLKPRGPKEILDELLGLRFDSDRYDLVNALYEQAESIKADLLTPDKTMREIKARIILEQYQHADPSGLFLQLAETLDRLRVISSLEVGEIRANPDYRDILSNAYQTLTIAQNAHLDSAMDLLDTDDPVLWYLADIKQKRTGQKPQDSLAHFKESRFEDRQDALGLMGKYEKAKNLIAELCDRLDIPVQGRVRGRG